MTAQGLLISAAGGALIGHALAAGNYGLIVCGALLVLAGFAGAFGRRP